MDTCLVFFYVFLVRGRRSRAAIVVAAATSRGSAPVTATGRTAARGGVEDQDEEDAHRDVNANRRRRFGCGLKRICEASRKN